MTERCLKIFTCLEIDILLNKSWDFCFWASEMESQGLIYLKQPPKWQNLWNRFEDTARQETNMISLKWEMNDETPLSFLVYCFESFRLQCRWGEPSLSSTDSTEVSRWRLCEWSEETKAARVHRADDKKGESCTNLQKISLEC